MANTASTADRFTLSTRPSVDLPIPADHWASVVCGASGSSEPTGSLDTLAKQHSALGVLMWRFCSLGLVVVTMVSCRDYHLSSRITNQDGLVPADQYARYGREQAEEIAIAREFGHASQGSSADQRKQQAEAGAAYARSLPDVVGVKADPQGLLLTVQFKSGWRTMITPLQDGKRGAETAGLPGTPAAKPK
jgi:hypothetical protein